MKATIPFLLFSVLLFFSGNEITEAYNFHISNQCPYPIWPANAPNQGHPVLAYDGFYLAPGEQRKIQAPADWVGRIWARTGCKFGLEKNPACETGDCGGRLCCNGLIGNPPATLIQFALQPDKTKPSFYDVSLVDGYNIPVSVTAIPSSSKCHIGGCKKDVNSICPQELEVLNDKGEVVACKSSCLAFDNDKFCCRNEYGTPSKCKPSVYSRIFKEACPYYYSYAYDNPAPLVNCVSGDYLITFCPSTKWGTSEVESV